MKEEIKSDCRAWVPETRAGRFHPEGSGFLDKHSSFYTRLEEREAEGDPAVGAEGLSSWRSDSPLWPEPHADARPQPRGRSKREGRPRPHGDGGDPGEGVPPAATHRNKGAKRAGRKHGASTSHTAVLSDDHQLLLKGHGKRREHNAGTKRKNKMLRKYREDIDRAFRRGWEHFLSEVYRLTL
ncbi:uncharacterized protein sb:cb1058 [Chiloscyllium plagiosum]|uniref:uncharacterized protein sb:cb1058 n=1 Tax=Chiloscyllium plagiosum TaxID=36176 RepID=UPI001CB810E8|nr:uncharacterized protein sb:cb1058 [Chiloscyllium plagiosum]